LVAKIHSFFLQLLGNLDINIEPSTPKLIEKELINEETIDEIFSKFVENVEKGEFLFSNFYFQNSSRTSSDEGNGEIKERT